MTMSMSCYAATAYSGPGSGIMETLHLVGEAPRRWWHLPPKTNNNDGCKAWRTLNEQYATKVAHGFCQAGFGMTGKSGHHSTEHPLPRMVPPDRLTV